MKRDNGLFIIMMISFFVSCKDQEVGSVLELFNESIQLIQNEEFVIEDDSLAIIEGITCDNENLIVYDLHSGYSYTLFNSKSGTYITRFGTIGQGPNEIPAGCYGYLLNGCFTVFDDQTRKVMKYELDSLRKSNGKESPVCLMKYDIADAKLSRLISLNDTTFLGAGTYRSRYQFLLFDNMNNVIDYGVDIYNSSDNKFNLYTKFLSNQGDLVKQKGKEVFAYSLNFSSNLDIVEIRDRQIRVIKSLRLGNPVYNPMIAGSGVYQGLDLTESTKIGYINLSATSNYIYALYSDRQVYDSSRKSNMVLVFDWKGNAVKKYLLDSEVYYITINESSHTMYAAVENSEKGWSIVAYSL